MLGLFCLVAGTGAASAQAPQRPMPTLPLTQLDERGQAADLDNRTFSLTFAQPVPIKDLLILLVRGTSLSVVPDPAIAGAFIGELKNVTVRQALGLILRPLGLDYAVDAGGMSITAGGGGFLNIRAPSVPPIVEKIAPATSQNIRPTIFPTTKNADPSAPPRL